MQTEWIDLPSPAPGTQRRLRRVRLGPPQAARRVHIQAALHADEIPGLLVASHLLALLEQLEGQGALRSGIDLVPMANPVGLSQEVMGRHQGRFDQGTGGNFNRAFLPLTDKLEARLAGRWTDDADANTRLVREASLTLLDEALASAWSETAWMKLQLQRWGAEAELVLDLHCDSVAVMHLYTHTEAAGVFQGLADHLGARAVLLAEVSGGDPYDESLSRHWVELAARHPLHIGTRAVTVELRGETDVNDDWARQDAVAILRFLASQGHVDGALLEACCGPSAVPPKACEPTMLDAVETLHAPHAGVVIYRAKPGDRIEAGQTVAEVLCPLTHQRTPLQARHAGLLYAHNLRRHAVRGMDVARIAGTVRVIEDGPLLGL